jgi:hypothetical protein
MLAELLTLREILLLVKVIIKISICTAIANTLINDKNSRKKTKPLQSLLQQNREKEIQDQINKRNLRLIQK